MDIIPRLRQLGLSEYECKVLLSVVRLGAGDAKAVALDSGVPYSRVYDPLSTLISKGWVARDEGRPATFRATDLEAQVASYYATARQQSLEAVSALSDMARSARTTLTPSIGMKYGWDAFFATAERYLSSAASLAIVVGFGNESALGQLTDMLGHRYVHTTAYVKQGVSSRECAMRHIGSWNAEVRVLPFTPPLWLLLIDRAHLLVAIPTLPEEQCSHSEVKVLEMGNFTMGPMLEKIMAVAYGESYPYEAGVNP